LNGAVVKGFDGLLIKGDYLDFDVRVRYVETDQMGVVHHENYVTWFEIGRTEFCRFKGFPYRELEKMGYRLMITDLMCHYRKAIRYDDMVTIRTWIKVLRRRMMTFGYQVLLNTKKEGAAEGETRHICLDSSGRPRTIPESFRRSLETK
jgi:acyl-CoA thioester hydrolase